MKPPPYVLPDPLVTASGARVKTPADWKKRRRPELLELFRRFVYGRVPLGLRTEIKVVERAASFRKVRLRVRGSGKRFKDVFLHLHLPRSPKPAPAFLLICHSEQSARVERPDTEFWPVKELLSRGYAAAAFRTEDADPDRPGAAARGIRGLVPAAAGQGDAWGSLSAWAWASSRAMDALCRQPGIDPRKVALIGHSRGGKTALWAGAQDERFALVVSNNSGCGGASLTRGRKGESLEFMLNMFPRWCCPNLKAFTGHEQALPVDQHQLLALIAPRALYVASASKDAWADPAGERLALKKAMPVYRLLGRPGRSAYHLRPGGHALTLWDWRRYMDFADKLFRTR